MNAPVRFGIGLALLGGFTSMAAAALQEADPAGAFEESHRVDSMLARITPDRLAELRRKAMQDGRPQTWYDLGTALLLMGDWEGAMEPLQRAAGVSNEALEQPSAYNLGVAHGLAGTPGQTRGAGSSNDARRTSLIQARESFRRVLRADPGADDARWNLEVVEGWLAQVGGAGGGGGGGGGTGGGGDQPMTRAEADALLDAAAAQERRVQEERLERNRSRDPVAERNW